MTKKNRLFVRMTDAERERVRQIARDYRMTDSAFILAMIDYVDKVRPQLVITSQREGQQK
jgi:hypothetical protein